MIDPNDDGITHINIYSKGKTELGRLLSNFAHTPFAHPRHGRFESVEGFWYWLSTGMTHDNLRGLYGYKAKECGKQLTQDFRITNNPSFKDEILEAIGCKLREHPHISRMLGESTLPLTHYYHYGSKIIVLPQYQWLVDDIDRLRGIMQNGK